MIKAFGLGVLALFVSQVLWSISLLFEEFSDALALLLWLSPLLASFLASRCAPRCKMVLGVSMVFPFVFFILLFNFAMQINGGRVDFPGVRGAVILAGIVLFFGTLLCSVGAVFGSYAGKIRDR